MIIIPSGIVLTTVEKAVMASELEPDQWPSDILLPIPKEPVSIFGYQHVAMNRDNAIRLIEALEWTELSKSLGDARKAIKNNAVKVNRKPETNIHRILTKEDALSNVDAIVLELGKYNFGIIEMC